MSVLQDETENMTVLASLQKAAGEAKYTRAFESITIPLPCRVNALDEKHSDVHFPEVFTFPEAVPRDGTTNIKSGQWLVFTLQEWKKVAETRTATAVCGGWD